jgi:hypothetical protein
MSRNYNTAEEVIQRRGTRSLFFLERALRKVTQSIHVTNSAIDFLNEMRFQLSGKAPLFPTMEEKQALKDKFVEIQEEIDDLYEQLELLKEQKKELEKEYFIIINEK